MEAILALLFIAALTLGPLVVVGARDRRRESAEIVGADIRAAVRRRLHGESLLSVQVTPATLRRPGRVVLSTPSGYEYLTEAVWSTVATRMPAPTISADSRRRSRATITASGPRVSAAMNRSARTASIPVPSSWLR